MKKLDKNAKLNIGVFLIFLLIPIAILAKINILDTSIAIVIGLTVAFIGLVLSLNYFNNLNNKFKK